MVQQAADATEIHKEAIGLHAGDQAAHQLAHLQISKEGSHRCFLLREHQLAGVGIHLEEGHANGFAHQGLVVLPFIELGAGDEAAQAFQIAGAAAAVEAGDLHLHHLSFFLQLAHLVPGLAQGQGAAAHRDHAIGVLFAGDQHLHFQSFGEAIFEIGDHPKAALVFGHEARCFAADIDIDAIAFVLDDLAGHHITGGADGLVFIEGRQEGFFIEVEVIHHPVGGWGFGGCLGLISWAQQVVHAQSRQGIGRINAGCGGRHVGLLRLLGLLELGLGGGLGFSLLAALLFLFLFIDGQDGQGLLQRASGKGLFGAVAAGAAHDRVGRDPTL